MHNLAPRSHTSTSQSSPRTVVPIDPFPISSSPESFSKNDSFVFLANAVPNSDEGSPAWLKRQGVTDFGRCVAVRVTVSAQNLDRAAELAAAWNVKGILVQIQFPQTPWKPKVPPEGAFGLDPDECICRNDIHGREHWSMSQAFIANVRELFFGDRLVRIL